MKTILSICAFVLFSLAAYSQSVVGTWSVTVPADDQGNMITLTFELNDDNTYTYQENDNKYPTGTYSVKGNELHFKIDDPECPGTAICQFELKDASTLWMKPTEMPCQDQVPPPFTLKKQ